MQLSRKNLWAISLMVMSIGWILYLIRIMFGLSMFSPRGEPRSPTFYLVIAIIITVVSPIAVFMYARKLKTLKERGLWAKGVVTEVGGPERYGQRPVTVTFDLMGQACTVKQDADATFVKGERIRVLYDPQKPTRCEFHREDALANPSA